MLSTLTLLVAPGYSFTNIVQLRLGHAYEIASIGLCGMWLLIHELYHILISYMDMITNPDACVVNLC